jgi:hypothetical protein
MAKFRTSNEPMDKKILYNFQQSTEATGIFSLKHKPYVKILKVKHNLHWF